MYTLLVAVASFVGFIVAYHTYGKWLGRRIFGLDAAAEVPSEMLRDDIDYVPTRREIVFGHHFTSIAGTGPIVGPAIAVFWGWLPALLWVVLGSIFIGAVHDFGALVVSLRNRGQTVGEVAGRIITPRAKVLFLLVLFFALTVVLAVFGLVIATIFKHYPESVLSVWIELPIAVGVGYWVYRRGGRLLAPSLMALAAMYAAIYVGAYWTPIDLEAMLPAGVNVTVVWTVVLFVYCFVASVLPVWVLLQPRDYINSHELLVALGLLFLALLVAGVTGSADITSAPAVIPPDQIKDAPPIFPFLFITIACGAVSGFHCLVSSGTSSKQLKREPDAQYVGYGAMLLEGALAVVVIIACTAGVGMGKFNRETVADARSYQYVPATEADGTHLTGRAAWQARYNTTAGWAAFNSLPSKVGAFVEGGGNLLTAMGVPLKLAIAIVAVLIASFAATTLDTATRLQRYVVQELGNSFRITPLTNKYVATGFAVASAGAVAMLPSAPGKPLGTGGMILWPLFGATNQLLAGLALLVTVFYLWRRNKPVWFAVIPMVLMMVFPAWAMGWNLFNDAGGWIHSSHGWFTNAAGGSTALLAAFGVGILLLQAWMIVEAILIWPKARGVLEESLPPLKRQGASPVGQAAMVGESP